MQFLRIVYCFIGSAEFTCRAPGIKSILTKMSTVAGKSGAKKDIFMALGALGVVFGDIGTSPLYAMKESLHHAQKFDSLFIMGLLSMIVWSMVISISLKYLLFVMKADNKGEGGVLALTTLVCRRSEDTLMLQKSWILYIGLFGATFMIGDTLITPAISVMSSVEGLKIITPVFEDFIVPITLLILLFLALIQRFGTTKIGVLFGPIMLLWFSSIGIAGVYSALQQPEIFGALNPYYAYTFFFDNLPLSFVIMSSVFLVITGGEALYADMGHFGLKAISRAWHFVALPGLVLNYFGQGALILRSPELAANPFFYMVPEWALIPMVILACCSTVIASQAVISGLFSWARQAVQLGYLPRLRILHTSHEELGQIYVPAVNFFILIGTVWLVIEFKTSSGLAAAYGISVSATMLITTILVGLVARRSWGWSILKSSVVCGSFLIIELVFFSSNILKIKDGGWVPISIAAIAFFLITTWKRGRRLLMLEIRERTLKQDELDTLIEEIKPVSVPGTAIYMVGDQRTVPPSFVFNLKHNKVLHKNVIFLTIRTQEVPYVPSNERLSFQKIDRGFYRVVVSLGFSDSSDVPRILNNLDGLIPDFDSQEATYFLGREILIPTSNRGMLEVRKKVFSVMSKNAEGAKNYYNLPTEQVVEIGMQIEI